MDLLPCDSPVRRSVEQVKTGQIGAEIGCQKRQQIAVLLWAINAPQEILKGNIKVSKGNSREALSN